jgi:hypothetical protein
MPVNILIPYNFTLNDEAAIDFVVQRYGKRNEVGITLFHAFTPVPEIDTKNDPIMEKVVRNTSYLRLQQDGEKQALEAARQTLINHGFAGLHIHCLYRPLQRDVAHDIIDLWRREKFDVVVLNRNPGNIINYFSRSISKRVTRHVEGGIGVHIVN